MTSESLVAPHGASVLRCAPDGQRLSDGTTALDLIGEAMGCCAEVVVVPVERVADGFFSLGSGLAGDIVQKFVNYRIRLVVLGDITSHVTGSHALRDFVREANRGSQVWFVATQEELDERLQQRRSLPGQGR
ncbi:DUF4180 domain-containing protein [Streptomyces sp. NPDC048650]|uniref:DUF4180 domain-containing protein n=1 Tax=unclassified Streptomyces TaxID=2593676 RepID=UPI0037101593